MNIKCFMLETVEPEGYVKGETRLKWRRTDTGEIHETPYDFGVGAMWYIPHDSYAKGPDGKSLCVVTPRHPDGTGATTWKIDSRANNCTLPDDDEHRCWIRHGDPPNVTVDKNGRTCAAGAGSIQNGDWHGWLQNGYLHE